MSQRRKTSRPHRPPPSPFVISILWLIPALGASIATAAEGRAGMPFPALVLTYAWLALVLLVEGMALTLAFAGARSLWNWRGPVFIGRAAALALLGALGLFVAIALLSWSFVAMGMGFLDASVVTTTLANVQLIVNWITWKDAILGGWFIAIGLAVVSGAFNISRPLDARRLGTFGGILLGALLIVRFVVTPAIARLEPRDHDRAEAFMRLGLPTSAWWSGLMLDEPAAPRISTDGLNPRVAWPGLPEVTDRPNILVVSIESLRGGEAALEPDGRPIMPTLARLSREGVHFTRAYAASNGSAYSLTATVTSTHSLKALERDGFVDARLPYVRMYDLLSGPYVTGFFSAADEHWQNMGEVTRSPSLTRFFDASTAESGHIAVQRADSGMQDAVQRGILKNGHLDDSVAAKAFMDWTRELKDSSSQRPFFAVLKFESSHFPYQQGFDVPVRFSGTELSDAEDRSLRFYSYPSELTEKMRRRYWNSLSYEDALLEGVLKHLEQIGLGSNTVVIVFGDHGQAFHEKEGEVTHAGRLSEMALNAELVVWGARALRPQRYDAPVSLLDIGPMVLRLAGGPPYPGFQGAVPGGLDRDDHPDGSRPIFSVTQAARFEESVVVGDWRYVRQSRGLYEHLYNVRTDRAELVDRISDRPEIANCLHDSTIQFQQRQVAYWSNREVYSRFFPPSHVLADTPSCTAAFRSHSTR